MSSLKDYTEAQAALCKKYGEISPELYSEKGVKRGLRDVNGKGVVTGLTNISRITAFKKIDGEEIPCDGELLYRGYDIKDTYDEEAVLTAGDGVGTGKIFHYIKPEASCTVYQ